MSDIDPFEILQGSNPLPLDDTPAFDSTVGVVVRRRVDAKLEAPRDTSRRRVLVYAVAALIAALVMAAASWAIRRAVVEDSVSTACFVAADVSSDRSIVAGASVEVCRAKWQSGELVNVSLVEPPGIPRLIGCVSAEGSLWVFPGEDGQSCERLGLSELERITEETSSTQLAEKLLDKYPPGLCADPSEVRSSAEEFFSELEGLEDWSVSVLPGDESRPCASFSVEAENKVVRIAPVPIPPVEDKGTD